VIMIGQVSDDLIARGQNRLLEQMSISPGTLIAVAIRSGAPKPNISTVDAFSRRCLGENQSRSMPARSGIYLHHESLSAPGIAKEMAGKNHKRGVPLPWPAERLISR